MKPSGFWLVESIWEPKFFSHFTKALRKLGINKAALDDHFFYKMSPDEIHKSGYQQNEFKEKDLRGYFILDDELLYDTNKILAEFYTENQLNRLLDKLSDIFNTYDLEYVNQSFSFMDIYELIWNDID